MTQQKNNTAAGLMAAIGILSISAMGMGSTVLTPALAVLSEHFGGRDVSFATTLATLGVVLGSVISGMLAGSVISGKKLAILGNVLCAVLGFLPFFFDDYTLLMTDRFFFGAALGLATPIPSLLIAQNYKDDAMSRMMGFTSMCMSIGGIVFEMLGGVLADISWKMPFIAHLFFLTSAFLCLFIPEDPVVKKSKKDKAPKEPMNWKVVMLIAMILLLFQMIGMCVMMIVSTMYVERGFGGATEAGTALTMYTVAGVASGLLFGKMFGTMKRFHMPAMMLLVAIGGSLAYFSTSHIMCVIAFILMGFGFMSAFPGMTTWIAMANPVSRVGFGTSIAVGFMNFGGFLSSFWMKALGYSSEKLIIAYIIAAVVLAVLLFVCSPFSGKEKA